MRVDSADAARLDRATDRKRDPMAPALGVILRRGVSLVLQEIEKKGGNK